MRGWGGVAVIGRNQGDWQERGGRALAREIAVGPKTAYCLAGLSWIS